MFRKIMIGAAAFLTLAVAAFLASPDVRTFAQVTIPCYMDQGGAAFHLGSGCTESVESGGVLNVKSGGALQIGGVDLTVPLAAAVSNPTAGVASGYKIARGATVLGGTNPTTVATGLTTVVACTASIVNSVTPGVGTSVITYSISTQSLNLYAWKVTSSGNPTLIASTGTETVGWVCIGT